MMLQPVATLAEWHPTTRAGLYQFAGSLHCTLAWPTSNRDGPGLSNDFSGPASGRIRSTSFAARARPESGCAGSRARVNVCLPRGMPSMILRKAAQLQTHRGNQFQVANNLTGIGLNVLGRAAANREAFSTSSSLHFFAAARVVCRSRQAALSVSELHARLNPQL
jgi:hypothetical protein